MDEKPKPTFDNLLSQLHETLANIQNFKGPLTPELASDIEKLEFAVSIFKKDTEKFLESSQIDIESLKKEVLESTDIRSNEKQFIKQAEDIEMKAKILKEAVTEAKGKGRKGANRNSNSENKQMKERKKLFKTIGGDKKWIPL